MAADMFDDDDKVIVRIEAPGMRREDFNIDLHGNVLTAWREKQFDREASYRDGVLRIELPKSEAARARRISVKTA